MPQAGLVGSSQVQQSPQSTSINGFLSNAEELGSAQDSFCALVENEYTSTGNVEEVEEHLTISWKAIISQAAQLSFTDAQQQRLVQFVASLQQRPALQANGQTCQVQGKTVWQDLPTFGWALRDAWNFTADDNSDKDSQDHWINLNAYVASLLGSTYSNIGDSLELSLFCIWTVRQAFEEGQQVSNTAVAAASAWFAFAAPTIWKLCQQQKSFDGKVAKGGSAFADAEWAGFSSDRWQAWVQKLTELEGQVSDDRARELVKQARAATAEIGQS